MIDATTLAAYVAIVLGFVFIPGPATLLTVARATSSGPRVGIATGAGIAALHAGIVQHDHVGPLDAAARAEIRRYPDIRAGMVGRKSAHAGLRPRSIVS